MASPTVYKTGSTRATPTREEFESHKNFIFSVLGGVVVVVIITFLIEISAMHRNYAQDKGLALQNNQLNKDYFDKVLQLQNQINQINTELQVTKVKNYLK